MTTKTTKSTTKTAAAKEEQREDPRELTKTPDGAQPSPGPKPAEDRAEREFAGEATTVRVQIKKDTSELSKRVFEHEVVILQVIHGEENVEVVEGSEDSDPIGDASQEHERLMRVYGKKGSKAVREIYPTAAALASEAGLKKAPARATRAGMELRQQSKQRGEGVK